MPRCVWDHSRCRAGFTVSIVYPSARYRDGVVFRPVAGRSVWWQASMLVRPYVSFIQFALGCMHDRFESQVPSRPDTRQVPPIWAPPGEGAGNGTQEHGGFRSLPTFVGASPKNACVTIVVMLPLRHHSVNNGLHFLLRQPSPGDYKEWLSSRHWNGGRSVWTPV